MSPPVGTAAGYDFDATCRWPLEKPSPVAAKDHERPGIGFLQPEIDHQSDHAILDGGRVGDLAQKRVELCESLMHALTLFPGIEVHGFGAIK